MQRNPYKTVDEYLRHVPLPERKALQELRATIKKAAPEAEERISYMIPAYYYARQPLVFFALQKKFCSFYGVGSLFKEFEKELKSFEVSGKSVHFTPEHPLPKSLVIKMVKLRMKQNEARKAKKTTASKKPVRRKRYSMPAFVKRALLDAKLMERYEARPPYQRNDYLMWIHNAKQEATKQKRLAQMLRELKAGNAYMNMPYRGDKS